METSEGTPSLTAHFHLRQSTSLKNRGRFAPGSYMQEFNSLFRLPKEVEFALKPPAPT